MKSDAIFSLSKFSRIFLKLYIQIWQKCSPSYTRDDEEQAEIQTNLKEVMLLHFIINQKAYILECNITNIYIPMFMVNRRKNRINPKTKAMSKSVSNSTKVKSICLKL